MKQVVPVRAKTHLIETSPDTTKPAQFASLLIIDRSSLRALLSGASRRDPPCQCSNVAGRNSDARMTSIRNEHHTKWGYGCMSFTGQEDLGSEPDNRTCRTPGGVGKGK